MTKAALDKYLQNATPRAILLYGECEFLINFYAQIVLNRLQGLGQDSNQNLTQDFRQNLGQDSMQNPPFRMDFTYNHFEATNTLGLNSLFGGKNVLHLRLDDFKAVASKSSKSVKSKAKPKEDSNKKFISNSEVSELLEILERNKNSFLVVEFLKNPSNSAADYAKKFKALSALFKPTQNLKDVLEMRCFEPFYEEKIKILTNRSNELNLSFTQPLLEHLLNAQNGDIAMAFGELNKYVYYPQITHKLIDELSYNLGALKIESLLDSLFDKKGHLVMILETLNDEGLDNMELLREINRYFYILFKLYAHSKSFGNMNALEVLGYKPPPQIFNVWSRRSLKIKTQTYLELFDIINEWRVKQMRGINATLPSLIAIQQIL